MKMFLLALTIGSLLLSAACDVRVDRKMESEVLLKTDFEFAELSADSGAAKAFRHYMAPDAIQMPDGALPITGRDSIYASLAPYDGKFVLTWQPQLAEVAGSGDMGWTWGLYKSVYRDAQDSLHVSYGKYVNVWVKQPDGRWLVRVDIGNKNPSAAK